MFHAVDLFYTRMLEWAMSHRAVVAVVAVLVLFSSVPLFMVANKNFLPNDDQSEFEINLRAPEGTSLESTEVITNRITNAIRSQTPEVMYTLVQIAGDGPKTRNLSTIYVRLKPIEERRRDQFVVMDDIRSRILPPLATAAADIRAAGRQHRRRRQSERRHPVHHQRSRPGEARHLQQAAGRARARR